jgi:hypothetical protein
VDTVSWYGFRKDQAEKRISEIEDKIKEILHTDNQKEKNIHP